MALYEIDGVRPRLGAGAWVAPTAAVIGDVTLGENATVWFGAVIRGDNDRLVIGNNTNVQDLSVLHTDLGIPLVLGANVTIGHQVMLHGCMVGDNSLIGIQSIVLNNARIGRNCVVGAGSLVTEGKEFPDNSLILGAPARFVRVLDEAAIANLKRAADGYVEKGRRYAGGLKVFA